MTNLIKSHRATGLEVGRTDEYVLVQTAPGPGKVLALKAITTQPGTEADVLMQLRIELFDAIAKAKFLGLDMTAISSLIADELSREQST